ncbi:ankyrin repeat-containing domain protein, partial [Baffinella frigidus]
GGLNTVKRLLAKGVTDIEQTNGAGLTPLQAAACNGFDDVVDLLLEHGADMLATTYKGMTLLHFAGGSHRRIRVNARAENGDTPLSRAVQTGTVDSVQQLLDSNADTSLRDAEGRSQLHHTTRLGMVEKSDMLIMHMTKSDIDAQDRDGETAL